VSLEIEQREKEGVIVLDLKGNLRFGEEDLQLRQSVEALKRAGKTSLILNLENMSEMDRTGVETLVLVSQELGKTGGRMVVLCPPKSSAPMLVLLELESSLEIFEDEQLAVDSFFPDRKTRNYDILSFVEEQGLVEQGGEKKPE
jgi:anti-sigma B factor antagonist